jgi:hypothetical protein
MARTQRHAPFNVVIVLRFDQGPRVADLPSALEALAVRHPLLTAQVARADGREVFAATAGAITQTNAPTETAAIHAALAHRFVLDQGPLAHATAVGSAAGVVEVLVLTLPHLVIDATSGTALLRDLLTALAGAALDPPTTPLPSVEEHFPPTHRGWRGRWSSLGAVGRDLGAEVAFAWARRGRPALTVPTTARQSFCEWELDQPTTSALLAACRRERLTLASTLACVWAAAYSRRRDGDLGGPVRVFTMADLRRSVRPPLPREALGAGWAMLRSTILVPATSPAELSLLPLAVHTQTRLAAAVRRGDAYTSHRNAELMMSMALGPKPQRMGELAVSYPGVVDLGSAHGALRLGGLQVFVATMDIGPAVVVQHRIWSGKLGAGITVLDHDFDRSAAQELSNTVLATLDHLASRPGAAHVADP